MSCLHFRMYQGNYFLIPRTWTFLARAILKCKDAPRTSKRWWPHYRGLVGICCVILTIRQGQMGSVFCYQVEGAKMLKIFANFFINWKFSPIQARTKPVQPERGSKERDPISTSDGNAFQISAQTLYRSPPMSNISWSHYRLYDLDRLSN